MLEVWLTSSSSLAPDVSLALRLPGEVLAGTEIPEDGSGGGGGGGGG